MVKSSRAKEFYYTAEMKRYGKYYSIEMCTSLYKY